MFSSDVIVAEKSIFDIVVGRPWFPRGRGGGDVDSANRNWSESNQASLPLHLVSFDWFGKDPNHHHRSPFRGFYPLKVTASSKGCYYILLSTVQTPYCTVFNFTVFLYQLLTLPCFFWPQGLLHIIIAKMSVQDVTHACLAIISPMANQTQNVFSLQQNHASRHLFEQLVLCQRMLP